MRSEQSQESPSNNQDREHDDQSSQETNMDFVKSGEELIAVVYSNQSVDSTMSTDITNRSGQETSGDQTKVSPR